jgi:hypothetical protein
MGWGIYEMGLPEGANMKAPRGFNNPLGPFMVWFRHPFKKIVPKKKGGKRNEEDGFLRMVNYVSSCHGICTRKG